MIKSYDELDKFLKRMDPPKPGLIRVFRGQADKHAQMLPTALRPNAKPRASMAWDSYTFALAQDLLSHAPDRNRPGYLELFRVWVHAMAQHYGPGTSYLDVSHSAELALWFALHNADGVEVEHKIGPPGPDDPKRDSVIIEQWLRFQASDTGYLFVFDVPKWDGWGLPRHGQLVDLAEAPEIFASSERLRIQKACLITADATEKDNGDLMGLVKGEPIQVGRPMTGSTLLGLPSDALFPGPAKDNWYRRFLCLPFVSQTDYKNKTVEQVRPWPVTAYMPTSEAAIKDLLETSARLSPLAMNLGSFANLPLPQAVLELFPWANYQLTAATPMILETPLLFTTAPADSNQWNQGILVSDMADNVETIDLATGQSSGPVDLTNVFLEFSLLERAGWERIENPNNKSDLIRAMWLMRNQNQFVVHTVLLSFPDQEQKIVGPFLYRFDPLGCQLQRWSLEFQNWANLSEAGMVNKMLFVALTVLRAVSPSRKPDPFPSQIFKTNKGQYMFVSVRDQAAKLVRVMGEPGGNDWYALKEAKSDMPFFFSPESMVGELELNGSGPWSQLDPKHIRSLMP